MAIKAGRIYPKHYAIVSLPAGSRLCVDESMDVLAFRSRADRDRFVAEPIETRSPVLRTHGEVRYQATRRDAAQAAAEIEVAVRGGRPSLRMGYACLEVMGVHRS